MDISLRSMLTAGVGGVAATAVVFASSVTPLPEKPSAQWLPVQLSAAVTTPADPALNVIERIAPSLFTPAPAPSLFTPAPAPPAVVQPQNAVSNAIDFVYSISRYWANYVSLDLGPWLIGWIPFGYLINDQIYIWYPTFVLPVVDSFVYDFLDPVVNNPLNINVWLGGLGAIANTAWNGFVSGVQQEINYFLSLQWLPFPIPPLPPFPLAATASATSFAQGAGATTLVGALRDALAQVSGRLSDASKQFFGSLGAIGSGAPMTLADRIEVAVEKFQNLAGDLLPQVPGSNVALAASDASKQFFGSLGTIGSGAPTTLADRIEVAVEKFQNLAGDLLPQVPGSNVALKASTDPGEFSLKTPRLLTDVLTPFTEARDALRAATAAPAADALDGTKGTTAKGHGIAPALTALKERLTTPGTVKQPRNIIREALKAQAGKDADTGTGKPAKTVTNNLKKVAKNVEKAGDAIGKALQGKLKKAAVGKGESKKDTANSE
jgi:hypothetical protein